MKKKFAILLLCLVLIMTGCGNGAKTESGTKNGENTGNSETSETPVSPEKENSAAQDEGDSKENASSSEITDISSYEGMTASEIVSTMTLEEKARQMLIPAIYNLNDFKMSTTNYGSILSTYGLVKENAQDWVRIIDSYQKAALEADSPIPFIYGQDSVHGVNYSLDSVIFPHNINIGAANDPELTYEMGLAVADEIKLTKMIWNYAPCVAVASDPRWGRTYESYSSDPEIVKNLSGEFARGLIEGGVIACPKHYIGDGSTKFGSGETTTGNTMLIDRGNAELTDEEIKAQLEIYKHLIDQGAQTIMISHSSLNGVKMHENRKYIIDVLRGELGFEGVVVSDWESIQNITSTTDYKEQVITSINSGIDWLMEPSRFEDCVKFIVEAVEEGKITPERIDEAVTRIIQLKMDAGLFSDPYLENIETRQDKLGSEEYRSLARTLAEKSLVLLKNENQLLPLKEGTKIFITGPASNDTGVQCGGWTRQWQGMTDAEMGNNRLIAKGTTILDGLKSLEKEYNLTIITDKDKADEADIILLCIGEKPYAEWYGDTADLSITGTLSLPENKEAIKLAKSLKKPTITLLTAGRNVIIDEYEKDWDSIVMCGLFGSEGDSVANVLTGKSQFSGKLAMPWYKSVDDIKKSSPWLPLGYGLTY